VSDLKGQIEISKMMNLLTGIVLAVVLLLALLYLGVGVFIKANVYDAKMTSEIISGSISALASMNMNGTVVFRLPVGECTIDVSQDNTEVEFPKQGKLLVDTKVAEVQSRQCSRLNIIRPNYIKVEKKKIECSTRVKRALIIEKINDDIKFEVIDLENVEGVV
jgi:hypothetical protein